MKSKEKSHVRILEPEHPLSGFRIHGNLRDSVRDLPDNLLHPLDVTEEQAQVTQG